MQIVAVYPQLQCSEDLHATKSSRKSSQTEANTTLFITFLSNSMQNYNFLFNFVSKF